MWTLLLKKINWIWLHQEINKNKIKNKPTKNKIIFKTNLKNKVSFNPSKINFLNKMNF